MNEFNMYEREIETRQRSERLLEGTVWPRVRRSGSWPGVLRRTHHSEHGLARLAESIGS